MPTHARTRRGRVISDHRRPLHQELGQYHANMGNAFFGKIYTQGSGSNGSTRVHKNYDCVRCKPLMYNINAPIKGDFYLTVRRFASVGSCLIRSRWGPIVLELPGLPPPLTKPHLLLSCYSRGSLRSSCRQHTGSSECKYSSSRAVDDHLVYLLAVELV